MGVLTGLIVLTGCVSVLCLSLVLLIAMFQAPLWHSYLPVIEQLHTDIWRYLLADNTQGLINHAQLDAHEERHLLDVKRLLQRFFMSTSWIVVGSSTSLSVYLYWAKTQWRQVCSGIALLGLTGVGVLLLLVMLAGFRSGFIRFHELLFVPGSWWFSPDSGLIQAFPLSYFQQFAAFFGLLISIIFVLLYGVSGLRAGGGNISSSADTQS